jgi:hypothetical protein
VLEFTDTGNCLVGTQSGAPSFTDDVCDGSTAAGTASYTIPETDHVTYMVDGAAVAAGTYPVSDGATVTIEAVADEGYTLEGTSTFTHEFAVPNCPQSVDPGPVTFSDDVCTDQGLTEATYTIPQVSGVTYLVDGAVTEPGTYSARDGSTVTVAAQAQDGSLLSGTTTWSHTFAATPPCYRILGQSRHPHQPQVSGTHEQTAFTGAPVLPMIIGGIALLVFGGLLLGFAGRRPGSEPAE